MNKLLILLLFINTAWAGFPRGDREILFKDILSFKDLSYAIHSLSADPTSSGVSANQGSLGIYSGGLYVKGSGGDTDWDLLQNRVSGTCSAGSSIRVIDVSGGVTCETDDNTNAATLCASGEYLDGNGSCLAIPSAGSTYSAGNGIALTGTTFSVAGNTGLTQDADGLSIDSSYTQRRVSGTCAAGTSIRVIAVDGTVTCETDDNTNAATICASGQFLNGDGTCDPVVVDTNTNAATLCASGEYLDGDGTCKTAGGGGSTLAWPHRWNEFWFDHLASESYWCAGKSGGTCLVEPTSSDGSYPHGLLLRSSATNNSGARITSFNQDNDVFGTISHKLVIVAEPMKVTTITTELGYMDSLTGVGSAGHWIEVKNATASCKTKEGASTTTHGTTYTVTANTIYFFELEVNTAGTSATCTIRNTSGTSLWSVSNTTNIPTGSNKFGYNIYAEHNTTSAADLFTVFMLGIGTIEGYDAKRSF